MIVFHEGLPRAGKSYEAMSTRIIPALQGGRPVVAYVEGLNFERIAEASGVPLADVQRLLLALTREQVKPVHYLLSNGDPDKKRAPGQPLLDHAVENALYVLDEAQNFWPKEAKLSDLFTEFITEHGHHGRDIVLMGQDLRDVAPIWRRRVEIRLSFLKMSAVGMESRYSVTTFRNTGRDKYEKVGTQVHKYDPKYFGTYASHVSTSVQTGNYRDKRASVWSGYGMRYGVPLALAVGAYGLWSSWKFFHPEPVVPKVAISSSAAASARIVPSAIAAASAVLVSYKPSVQEKRLADNSSKYRIRLAGLLSRSPVGSSIGGVIEWVEGGGHVIERMTLDDLRDLGVAVVVRRSSVMLALGQWEDLATTWPIESESRMSNEKATELRGREGPASVGGGGAAVSMGGSRPTVAVDATRASPEPLAPIVVRRPVQ